MLAALFLFAGTASAQLVSESFTGATGTRPQGWGVFNAKDGIHWIIRDGYLVSGSAESLPAPAPSFATVDVGRLNDATDYVTSTDFWMVATSGRVMLLGRWRDPATHYALLLESDGKGGRTAQIDRIFRGTAATLQRSTTALAAFERTSPPARPHRLSMDIQGNRIRGLLDGQIIVEAVDNLPLLTGTVGVGQSGSLVLFQAFKVEAVAAAAPTPAPNLPANNEAPALPGTLGEAVASDSIRVRVGSFASPTDAQSMLDKLTTELGYWNAFSQAEGAQTSVFLDVRTRDQADKLVVALRSEGFALAQVASGSFSAAPPIALPPGVPQELARSQEFAQMGAADRQRIIEIVSRGGNVEQGLSRLTAQPDLDPELRRKYDALATELSSLREQVAGVTQDRQDKAVTDRKISELREQASAKLQAGDVQGARRIVAEIQGLDANHSAIALIESAIQRRLDKINEQNQDTQQITDMIQRARELEGAGSLDTALQQWLAIQNYRNKSVITADIEREVSNSIIRINTEKNKRDARLTGQVDKLGEWVTYVAAGVGFLALVLVVYMLTAKRRVKKIMEEQLPQMVLPAMELHGAGMLALDNKPQQLALPAATSPNNPAPPPPAPAAPPLSPPARPGAISRPPAAPAAPPRPVAAPAANAPTTGSTASRKNKPAPKEPTGSVAKGTGAPSQVDPPTILDHEPISATNLDAFPKGTASKSSPAMPVPDLPDFSGLGNLGGGDSGFGLNQPAPKGQGLFDNVSAEDSLSGLLQGLPGEDTTSGGLSPLRPVGARPRPGTSPGASPNATPAPPSVSAPRPAAPTGSFESPLAGGSKPSVDFGDFGLGDSFKVAMPTGREGTKGSNPPAAERKTAQLGEVFRQDFESDPLGEKPANWDGAFEFAELKVVSSSVYTPGNNQPSRSVLYEKKAGSGQVYYACSFPDVRGVAEVEFDVCCVEKNRYLLGVYIEKNRDFRNSIHTVFHLANPQAKPMLRLQGTPTNYTLGTWTHVKFRLELTSKKMRAEVDDKVVLEDEFIESMPDLVNTLAIRDNHPTTGQLLLSNIVVRKLA